MVDSAQGTNCGADGTACAYTTDVLPLKFVKMQARTADGTALGDDTGYSNAASFGDSNTYTYWMLLDNYCRWGSAQCKWNNNVYPDYQAWNGDSSGSYDASNSNNLSMVLGNTNTGTANSNAASMQNNNYLNTLDRFYDSLPTTIANQPKGSVIPNFTWDMMGNNTTNPSVAGWYQPASRLWQTGTYDPTPSNGNDFVFSGDNTAPTLTTRINLPSFTEWQGGTSSYKLYTSQSPTNGSGGSFCQARFGTDCTNAGTYGLFYQPPSAANPLPYYPWMRSPQTSGAYDAWYVVGEASYSLDGANAHYSSGFGVSPSLWLSANLPLIAGAGSYDTPYCINTGDCDDEVPTPTFCTATDDPAGVADTGCAVRDYDTVPGKVGIHQLIATTIEESLAISTADAIGTNLIPTPAGTEVTLPQVILVSTNNPNGYYLTLENTSTNTSLIGTNVANTIFAVDSSQGSAALTTTLNHGAWGYRLANTTANQYYGVPALGSPTTINNVANEVANDQTVITYGVKADTTQPVDTYTTTVLYSAVAGNPSGN
jgi:hypothetical protein